MHMNMTRQALSTVGKVTARGILITAVLAAVIAVSSADRRVSAEPPGGPPAFDLDLLTAVYAETVIDATVNDESALDLLVGADLDIPAGDVLVGIFAFTANPPPGRYHWRGPGMGSIWGLHIFPPPIKLVMKKVPPSTRVYVFRVAGITFCITRFPLELIAFCRLDAERIMRRASGTISAPSTWDYTARWSHQEVPNLPTKIDMPTLSELQTANALPHELVLHNLTPGDFGLTLTELETAVARELLFFPFDITLPGSVPSAITIPKATQEEGVTKVESDVCGDVLEGIDTNPANNCVGSTASVTLRIEACNGVDDDADTAIDEGCTVGGIAELPDEADGAPLAAGDSSGASTGVIAGIAAAIAAGALTLGGAGWYARRRWLP